MRHTTIKEHLGHTAGALQVEDRRRTQRVIIRLPITLLTTDRPHPMKIVAKTVEVNSHGAMLSCLRAFDPDTRLDLVNEQTREHIVCRVTRSARESAEGFLMPVEFVTPSPNFWQISFPPKNWRGTDI